MGVSQHVHGTDNARCLISLVMMCGHVGRPGTGLHPLRGQNNVQGASDAGLIPMVFPDYNSVTDPAYRGLLEDLWATKLDPEPGLTVVEIMDAIHDGPIRGMYVMGENPAMSDPDAHHAREALAKLEHLVVQDIFLTETAMHADVVLPASAWPEKDGTVTNTNRTVQMGRRALPLPGEARPDWWITQEIARRMGQGWAYAGPADVFAEMKRAMPSLDNITWERLEREDAVTYPCPAPDHPGLAVVFTDGDYPTADGRAKLVPAAIVQPAERPDEAFPFILTTGRTLEHWHTGSMTRRAGNLDALEPEAFVSVNSLDMRRHGLRAGEYVDVATRRGAVRLMTRQDNAVPEGVLFIPFCFAEAAANLLTNPQLDPFGRSRSSSSARRAWTRSACGQWRRSSPPAPVGQVGADATLAERFRRARNDPDLAVLEGLHALKHALRFGAALEEAVAVDPAALARLAEELAPDVAGRVAALARPVTARVFATLAPSPPATGVIAIARRPAYDVAGLLAAAAGGPVVLLERPTHPGNLGAVVRVAAAAGAAGVLTTGGLDPWSPAALRGSAGLHFALPVARVEALPATARPLLALDPAGEPLEPASLPAGAVLAFGTERGGLSAELRARAVRRLALPMRPGVSSLNLATAVAAVLYATRRGRPDG
jgi:tRNA G18 (ribose-2'-O)-methylase SpoU/formylmethanofuran dehydrogenase subunit D